ncbi:MAG TPA: ACT domain-containing protein [Mycobacteriales bacterium]|nr:ACT domain-containing protein [Mycobacteriales bacterium]
MTYLLRVVLPDRPGSLGAVASAIGAAGGDIVSLDVVERGPDGAVDDLVVELSGGLADVLITAAQSVEGVVVESLRPYQGGQDIHRDLELVDELAADAGRVIELLVAGAPGVFRAGWALLIEHGRVVIESAGAPDSDGMAFPWFPLTSARRMDHAEDWVPPRWNTLGMEMAAAPVGDPRRVILIGRPGGPRFRASEVVRLAHLAGIASTVARTSAPVRV